MYHVIGCDSETFNGPPISFQFFSDNRKLTNMIWTNEKDALKDFFGYLDTIPQSGIPYLIWGHNLSFDDVSFLYSKPEYLVNEEVEFTHDDWKISGLHSNLCFLNFLNLKTKVRVTLLDTFAFFPTSLKKLEVLFELGLPKLEAPEGLGSKRFSRNDSEFVAYAMRDAEIAYHVGCRILALHNEYDIPVSVSRAQFSAKIFRKCYLKEAIPATPKFLVGSAWQAYHGGKNGLYCKPGLHKAVYGLDIVSAYPHAMSGFPSFCSPTLYYKCRGGHLDAGSIRPTGIYNVWGESSQCVYPSLYKRFEKKPMVPVFGKVEGVWVTGYELIEAIDSGEFELDQFEGYGYKAELDKKPSPLSNFSREFFELKNSAKTQLYREFYKVILNSISGKLIETHKVSVDCETGYDLNLNKFIDEEVRKTGAMFNPFIAALITGHTRARIHKWEHQYNALHTSTDGIFCTKKPNEISGLGGQKIDFFGDVLIVRNKLYICYTDKFEDGLKSSVLFPGKYIKKYALHAFLGDVTLLETMILNGVHEYEYTHVNKIKESLKRGLKPNEFVRRKGSVKNNFELEVFEYE